MARPIHALSEPAFIWNIHLWRDALRVHRFSIRIPAENAEISKPKPVHDDLKVRVRREPESS